MKDRTTIYLIVCTSIWGILGFSYVVITVANIQLPTRPIDFTELFLKLNYIFPCVTFIIIPVLFYLVSYFLSERRKQILFSVLFTRVEQILDASEAGDVNKVRKLLGKKKTLVNSRDESGETPLHRAVRKDCSEIAKLLLDKGANVNAKANDGKTPLHGAACAGRIEIAELLLNKGADIDAKTNSGEMPLHIAAIAGQNEFIKFLVMKGAEINAKDNRGRTPLHLAVKEERLETIAYLLNRGADVHAKDNDNDTPHLLMQAKERAREQAWRRMKQESQQVRTPVTSQPTTSFQISPPKLEVLCCFSCPSCGKQIGFDNTEFVMRYNLGHPRFGVVCNHCTFATKIPFSALDPNEPTRMRENWERMLEPYHQ